MADTVDAVAVKEAAAEPAGTAIEAGAARLALLLASATTAPPAGAAALRLTVQFDDPGVCTDVGLQARLLSVAGDGVGCEIVTTPPLAESVALLPVAVAAKAFVICTAEEVLEVVAETVNVATAATPFEIGVPFIPQSRQVEVPAPEEQEMDLPAA